MTEMLYRKLELEAPVDDQAELIPATLSTEHPVDRGDYTEILQHSRDAIDLSRFPLPVIEAHDGSRLNIGLAENPSIENGRLRADIRFGSSARAREVLADVCAGIVRNLSIGYLISEFETVGDILTATRWLPYECSAVSVPADPHAGFFRGVTMQKQTDDVGAERDRVSAIMQVARKLNAVELASAAIENGTSPEGFYRSLLESDHVNNRAISFAPANEVGLDEKDTRRFSFLKAIRAQLPGASPRDIQAAAFERECSDAAAKQYRREPRGILVPDEVLKHRGMTGRRDLTVGTATAGGHTVATDLDSGGFIDLLRARLSVERAGARVLQGLQGNLAIPRETAGATAYWVVEGGAPSESQAAFDQVSLVPHTVGAFTDYSRKLVLQSSIDIEMFVRGDLAKTLAVEVDRVAIIGAPDASATANEPRGILNTSGIGAVSLGAHGAVPTRAGVLSLINEVSVDNVDLENASFLTNSQAVTKMMNTLIDTGSGKFLQEKRNELVGFPCHVSQNVPSNLTDGSGTSLSALIFGNFDDFLFGYWSGVDLLVDPYTASTTGTVRVVAMLDVDCAVRYAQSFAAIQDMVTT